METPKLFKQAEISESNKLDPEKVTSSAAKNPMISEREVRAEVYFRVSLRMRLRGEGEGKGRREREMRMDTIILPTAITIKKELTYLTLFLNKTSFLCISPTPPSFFFFPVGKEGDPEKGFFSFSEEAKEEREGIELVKEFFLNRGEVFEIKGDVGGEG